MPSSRPIDTADPGLAPTGEILLATDFCEPARRALASVRQLARARGAAVRALHVTDLTGTTASQREQTSYSSVRDSAERMLREIRRELRLAGVQESAMLIAAGRPAKAIREMAEQRRAGLIALGLNGPRSRRPSTLGATTRSLLKHAPCPVLTVGSRVPGTPVSCKGDCWCERALIVTDNHPESLAAALSAWPPPSGSEPVVRVVLPPDTRQQPPPEPREGTLPLAQAARLLLREAAARKTGVIVLALRTGGYLDSFAARTVAHTLVTRAACPVVTVRH